jgi:3'-phosphoadenosine 5'-phosphosulfate sulfotransferase (PAPS reductase)/FAD synthetase
MPSIIRSENRRLWPDELTTPHQIWERAIELHHPTKTFVLCSGGNDSMVLLDFARKWMIFDGIVHVDTGTGVREGGIGLTTQFVRDNAGSDRLHVLTPPKSFEELFIEQPIIDGLPGPGMHRIAYNRLKERALRTFVKEQKGHWRDRIMFLTGIREDESEIRMGYQASIIDRVGAQVWVNPLYRWTNEEMAAYRQEHNITQNPVSEHLHMSGECLCGCYARPGELEEIRFFFPETAARIEEWQRRAAEKGLTYSTWGKRRPAAKDDPTKLRLCGNCPGQGELTSDE